MNTKKVKENKMPKLIIEQGQRFGKLSAIKEVDRILTKGGQTNRAFLCKCDCGNEKVVRLMHLIRLRTTSCGCLCERHGQCHTKLYRVWTGMKNRCFTDTCINANRYKERGITICQEWDNSFTTFKEWAISNGYKEGLQIDRINNSGNYEPSNCRFVTNTVNVNNRDVTHFILYKGERIALTDLFRKLNIPETNFGAIRGRIRRGWDETKAIDTKIRNGKYKRKERQFA